MCGKSLVILYQGFLSIRCLSRMQSSYYYYFTSSNLRVLDRSEETIRDRAPKFSHNVDLMYTVCRKEFGDLDLHSLRVTLT